MQIINPGNAFSFNYATYDFATGLFIRARIYDVSSGSPSFVTTVNLTEIEDGFYSGNYTGSFSKTYLIIILVYTNSSYTTVDGDRAPSSDVYKSVDAPVEFSGFEYAAYDLDEDLFIASDIYDVTTGTPVIADQVIMDHVYGGVYFGSYEGEENHAYEIIKLAFTNDDYDVLNTDRSPGSDSFQLFSFGNVTVINNVIKRATIVGQSTRAILRAKT